MKANTCLLLLVIGWFVLGLPIALAVLVNSIIKIGETNISNDKLKYGICIAVSVIYLIIWFLYYF
jgi:hypothetical protein